ncbi:hypothetical protein V500_00256 [Pseudogymnoascus sp. VKM F-4518 (FW-2643)]|nr:hypothetical protein V500_00256 [Pseudogymnoascus sp. VKM F-4518 (FW-2643)]
MLFSIVLPLAAFASLATAQAQCLMPVGTFMSHAGGEFDISTSECYNFKMSQPHYDGLAVDGQNQCDLYADRDCGGDEVGSFRPTYGYNQIGHLEFKSVRCHHWT